MLLPDIREWTSIYVFNTVSRVKEQDIDAITGISGSGPAYTYLMFFLL